MTTLVPRPPHSREELDRLYPKSLKLQLVQILLRHGERTPVSARFQNAGLTPLWPYCNAAKQLSSVIMTKTDWSTWDQLQWRRRLETMGDDDAPVLATGPKGEIDGVCNMGELTDKGRETTLALGQRLRHLYVDQLRFMPRVISDADMIYFRASPMPRALESVQQSFWGLYPLSARTASFPPPTIITRTPQDETLYPNVGNCRRFSQLFNAFGKRAADRWNDSRDMEYLSSLLSKWMPDNAKVAVDSHPRLSGIMDTINSTLAHGPETRLPPAFYDSKAREIIENIGVEEWFSGFKESLECRKVGIGALAGDVLSRMVDRVEKSGKDGLEVCGHDSEVSVGRGADTGIKFGLSGCHDTSLAALLASLGCFEGRNWPPYTSHIAFELFREADAKTGPVDGRSLAEPATNTNTQSRLQALFSTGSKAKFANESIGRRPIADLRASEREKLNGYYVRIRYNDEAVVIPGCKVAGKHLEGDESFCTMAAFKEIVDKFTPRNWKEACMSNLDQPTIPSKLEPAGF